jgi:hypothetical protein
MAHESRAARLVGAQRALRTRFDDFTGAFERRDAPAYRLALADFERNLRRWTAAGEAAILPALRRAPLPDRDTERELRLEYVQVRELTRYLSEQIASAAPLADLLGLIENLERRLAAHETGMESVYYPAAAAALTDGEWQALIEAAPDP